MSEQHPDRERWAPFERCGYTIQRHGYFDDPTTEPHVSVVKGDWSMCFSTEYYDSLDGRDETFAELMDSLQVLHTEPHVHTPKGGQ